MEHTKSDRNGNDNTRPFKRPRLEVPHNKPISFVPSGFRIQNHSSAQPPKLPTSISRVPSGFPITRPNAPSKIPVQKFVNTFIVNKPSSVAKSAGDTTAPLQSKESLIPTRIDSSSKCQPLPVRASATLELDRGLSTTKKPPAVCKPPSTKPTSRDDNTKSKQRLSVLERATLLRPAPAPALVPQNVRRRPPPPLPNTQRPSSSLRRFTPPPHPKLRTPINKEGMKTISTTRFAKSMNLATEEGVMNLLSIQLEQRQVNSGTFPPSGISPVLARGLMQSPEKRYKSKGLKFIKGGLADFAQSAHRTDSLQQRLWEVDLENCTVQASNTIATPKKELAGFSRPDLILRVEAILSTTTRSASPHALHFPQHCLAQCTIIHQTPPPALSTRGMMHRRPRNDSKKTKGELDQTNTLFLICLDRVNRSARNLEVGENDEVWVWRPWSRLIFPNPSAPAVSNPFGLMVVNEDLKAIAGKTILLCARVFVR